MSGPLAGLRVLDLSRVLAGPYCTMILGDLGADVVKVEQPGAGDDTRQWGPPYAGGESAYYLAVNRNKRSITVNLKHPRGRQVVLALARQSDVVVENFKRGGLERLGLDYEQLSVEQPGLVWCSITGFGSTGPDADRPGYDYLAQAMGGLMSITGEPDGEPMKVGVAIADVCTGLFAAAAVLAALRERDRTGRGQRVEVSLYESVIALLINVAQGYLVTGESPRRYGNAHPNLVPYQVFAARDRPFVLAVGNDGQFRACCAALGRPELADDPRFRTNPDRVRNRDALVPLLAAVLATRPAAEWVERFRQAGVPASLIQTVDEVLRAPQTLAREMVVAVAHPTIGALRLTGLPYKLSATPGAIRRPPPLLGEHTDEVLESLLGLSAAERAALRAEGAI